RWLAWEFAWKPLLALQVVTAAGVVEVKQLVDLDGLVRRGSVVGADLGDPAALGVETVPLVAPQRRSVLLLPVRPLDHGLVTVVAHQDLFDGPLRAQRLDAPDPFPGDRIGAAPWDFGQAGRKIVHRFGREAADQRLIIGGVAGVEVASDQGRVIGRGESGFHVLLLLFALGAIAGRPAVTQARYWPRVSSLGGYNPHSGSPACRRIAR